MELLPIIKQSVDLVIIPNVVPVKEMPVPVYNPVIPLVKPVIS